MIEEDIFSDPDNINEIIERLKKCPTMKDINDLLYEIIAYCLEYGYEKCYDLVVQFANSPTILDSKIILQTEFFTEQKETQRENSEKLKTKITIADSIATCPECRSKKIFTVGTQSRGGDEGLTYNYTCQNCNWVWKKNS